MSLLSFIAIIGLIIYKLVAEVAIGWTSILAVNIFIGGIIIMVIGVVGIYIGNVFMQTKERPLYVVRQVLNSDK